MKKQFGGLVAAGLSAKRLILFSLAALLMVGPSPAKAGLLVPGGTNLPPDALDLPGKLTTADVSGPILKDTGLLPYSFGGGAEMGTLRELVVADALNPFGAGKLSFVYQVHVALGDITRITGGSYAGFLTDVAEFASHLPLILTGTHGADSADRVTLGNGGATVGFNFDPAIVPDAGLTDTTLALIVRTNADLFQPGFIGLQDTGAQQFDGWTPAPTPEPASILLAGFGAASMLGYGWKRRKVTACQAAL
jgi:hypothetical protein